MTFPVINTLAEFKEQVGNVPGIEFKTDERGYTVASYYILDDSVFNSEYARECRGITFDPNGVIASRPFHKFFNLNQKEATLEKNIDWNDVHTIMNKADGSMITPVLINGVIEWKTKRTFTSAEAQYAMANFGANSVQAIFATAMMEKGFTAIFELTSPANRIVVPYKEPNLALLAIRNNVTGEYTNRDELANLAAKYNVPVIEYEKFISLYQQEGIRPFKESVDFDTGIEGYVIQFNSGDMVKMKTRWYVSLHRVVTFVTEKNVAEMVIEQTLDDYKSYCMSVGETDLFDKVNKIESRVVAQLIELSTEVGFIIMGDNSTTPKEFAVKYKEHPLFHLLICKFRGKEPNYTEYFSRNFLSGYTNVCI